jgi:membrane protein involved in colicin uptake
MNHQAIYNLYPNVVSIDDTAGAMDANGDSVVIDMTAVNQEAERLQAEAQAQAEAKEQLRTSVINKIATNLTSEEKAWLEENL